MKSLFTKALLLMLSLCLMSFMTVAQGTIKGKIVDSQTKEPLVGATVMLEGTSEGVAADLEFYVEDRSDRQANFNFPLCRLQRIEKRGDLGKRTEFRNHCFGNRIHRFG